MQIINLTPHDVNIIKDGKIAATFPKTEVQARVDTKEVTSHYQGFPWEIVQVEYGDVQGLPEPKPSTFYIVSMVVAQALPKRKDLIVPNTSPKGVVRDENGQILGVKNFSRF